MDEIRKRVCDGCVYSKHIGYFCCDKYLESSIDYNKEVCFRKVTKNEKSETENNTK